jgi:hypothetical protein
MNKAFNQELYNQHNQPAIQAALTFLTQLGYRVVCTKESYSSHDLIVEKDGKHLKIEVEHSTSWRHPDGWQGYPAVTCPYRKRHSKADIYLMFNNPYTAVAVCDMKLVQDSPVITKDTSYMKNESFFSTPHFCYDFFVKNEPLDENRYL